MHKFIFTVFLMSLLGTQINAQAGSSAGTEIVTDAYSIDKMPWGGNGHILLALNIKNIDGHYAVCAAAVFNNSVPRSANKNALRALKLMVNNRVALRGLHWARLYPKRSDLLGREASCRVTNKPVLPGEKYSFQMAKTSF